MWFNRDNKCQSSFSIYDHIKQKITFLLLSVTGPILRFFSVDLKIHVIKSYLSTQINIEFISISTISLGKKKIIHVSFDKDIPLNASEVLAKRINKNCCLKI